MQMPEPDLSVIGRREEITAALRAIVPGEGVITETDAMRVYETDGLSAYRQLPMIVVKNDRDDTLKTTLGLGSNSVQEVTVAHAIEVI